MATLASLQAKIAELQAQAEAIVKRDSTAVIAKIRDLMEKHGLTTADIEAHVGGGKKRGRKPGVKVAAKSSTSGAKYRDPKTGATWTGHGRAPAWIAKAKDRSKFLVEGDAAVVSAPASKKAAKAGNYVRGPQAPKYRDPKSGAAWSGRGPAPAWLAGAKDRSRFLIGGVAGASTMPKVGGATKGGVAKKASAVRRPTPAKKVAAKKVAVKRLRLSADSGMAGDARQKPVRKPTVPDVKND